jgi:hypothetical protein
MGAKDYFQYQDTWSNKGDCCDAKGNVTAFDKTSQNVSWEERIRHAPHKDEAIKARDSDIIFEGNLVTHAEKNSLESFHAQL